MPIDVVFEGVKTMAPQNSRTLIVSLYDNLSLTQTSISQLLVQTSLLHAFIDLLIPEMRENSASKNDKLPDPVVSFWMRR